MSTTNGLHLLCLQQVMDWINTLQSVVFVFSFAAVTKYSAQYSLIFSLKDNLIQTHLEMRL